MPQNIDRDIFFICTGTGVAPFRSMLHYINRHKIFHKNLYLLFGTRLLTDCLYGDELKEMEKQIENYHYLPVFSREAEDNLSLRRGYVHAVYEEIVKDEKPAAYFYLCGWKNMVDEAKQRILDLGYDKKDIHLELYG